MKTSSSADVLRILCATDLTARSTAAWQRTASLARQTGARITLLHAIDSRESVRSVRMRTNRAYIELLSQVDRAFGSAAGFIDVVVRRGNVRDAIATAAREWNVDLIVMAAPKSRRLDSVVGTTAERLVRTTKCPVLVVRGVQGGYRHVAIATDLSSASLPMVRTAVRLGALHEAHATIVHAAQPPYDRRIRSAGPDEWTIKGYQRSSQEEARQRLHALVADAGLSSKNTRVIVRSDAAASAIRAVLEYERPELLVIGASRWFLLKRLLMGSVADQLLRAGSCDVLVIPHRPARAGLGVPLAGDSISAAPVRREGTADRALW